MEDDKTAIFKLIDELESRAKKAKRYDDFDDLGTLRLLVWKEKDPVAGEAQKPFAWARSLKGYTGEDLFLASDVGDPTHGDWVDGVTWRPLFLANAAPQASEADSGGIHPWGAPALIPCECTIKPPAQHLSADELADFMGDQSALSALADGLESIKGNENAELAAVIIRKLASAPVAREEKPVAWLIDWPGEPELGHYISESPAYSGRSRALVLAPAPIDPGKTGPWCCGRAQAQGVQVCEECAEISAGFQAAMRTPPTSE